MTTAEPAQFDLEADDYMGPIDAKTITPEDFLEIERRLFSGAKSPSRPKLERAFGRYAKFSEQNARRALESLLRSFQPGDPVGARDVQKVSRCSLSHARAKIYRLKQLDLWPFSRPPETRGRKPKPKESQHAGSVPPS